MTAKQMIAKLDGYGGIIPFNSEELDVTLRALRLLAAAEANDGNCPDTEGAACRYTGGDLVTFPKGLSAVVPYHFAAALERERNGLAARVRELEREVDSMRLNLKLLCAGFENGNAVYWVHDRPGIFNDALSAIDAERSEP